MEDRRNIRSVSRVEMRRRRRKRILIKFICVILSLIFMVSGIGCIVYFNILSGFNFEDINVGSEESGELVHYSGDLLTDPYVLNIMLFGADQYGEGGRSDTMMMMSLDNRREKIKLTSFLRDTLVYVPEYGEHKLNSAYAYGGAELSIQTIEANFGVQIDRYAVVNFETFKDIVDIMGGVEMELTDDEILYINCQIAQNNQSEYLPEGTEAGMVLLNGQQALWHARNRGGYVNGVYFEGNVDWDRVQRQRDFLNAVMDKLRTASLSEIVQIINAVGPNITTNLKNSEITALAANSLTYLSYDMEELSVPTDGTWDYNKNHPTAGDCIEIYDWDTARKDLAEFIYEDTLTDNTQTSDY